MKYLIQTSVRETKSSLPRNNKDSIFRAVLDSDHGLSGSPSAGVYAFSTGGNRQTNQSISFGHYQHDFRCQSKEHSRAQAVQVHGPDHSVHVLLLLRLPEGISAICGNIAAEIPWHLHQWGQLSSWRLQVTWQPFLALPWLTLFTIFRLQAAQIISILKFIIILCVLASFNPFPFLGVDTPAWAAWMLENKIYACMMTFFLCNAVETQVKMHSILPCF